MTILDTFEQFWPELLLAVGIFAVLLAIMRFLLRRTRTVRSPQAVNSAGSGRMIWNVLSYVLRLAGFAVLSFALVTLAIMVFDTYFSLKRELAPAPSQVAIPSNLPFQVEEITFLSEDGLRIAGWFVPSKNGATIILLHGYSKNRTAMLWHAKKLVAAGYGVLMYDERASGESEGTHRSYGWEDARDVAGALAYLCSRPEVEQDKLGIAGCSIGGQIALQGAAYNPEIGAVWSDGPATIRAQDIPPQRNLFVKLLVAGNYMMDLGSAIALGIDAPPPMIEIIGNIAPRPIMLAGGGVAKPLLGSEGEFISYYAEYAGSNAQVWVVSEGHHCDGPVVRPDEYAQKMLEFFGESFGIK